MKTYKKNILIGLFVIVAGCLITIGLLFLEPSLGDAKQTLRVRFTNIDKVGIGTRVTFAGKPIGKVVNIYEVNDARKSAKDTNGEVYFYELELKVDSGVNIYDTDDIVVRSSGLLGEKNIAIIPRPSIGEEQPRLVTEEIILANKSGSVEHALEELTELASKARHTLDHVVELIRTNSNEIHYTIKEMHQAMGNLDVALETVNANKLVDNVNDMVVSFNDSLGYFNTGLAHLQDNHFWQNVATTTDNLNSIMSAINQPEQWKETVENLHLLAKRLPASWETIDVSLNRIADMTEGLQNLSHDAKSLIKNTDIIAGNIAQGKGTLGQLIMNDALYLRAIAVMGKVDTIMNDINHYGILFQNNKSWQRQRIKRMNMLYKLNSPQAMQLYFDEEISQINAGLGRISVVLENMKNSQPKDSLLQNKNFAEEFTEILRQLKGLEGTLTLYNQEFISPPPNNKE